MNQLKRRCPSCDSLGVSVAATIAAMVDSDSRCSNCGAGLKYSLAGKGILSTSFLVGLLVGVFSASYWIGIAIFMLGLSRAFVYPLKIDKSDPISLQREIRAKISESRSKNDS